MPGGLNHYVDVGILSCADMVLPCGANVSGGAYSINTPLRCHTEVIGTDGEIWKKSRHNRVS